MSHFEIRGRRIDISQPHADFDFDTTFEGKPSYLSFVGLGRDDALTRAGEYPYHLGL